MPDPLITLGFALALLAGAIIGGVAVYTAMREMKK